MFRLLSIGRTYVVNILCRRLRRFTLIAICLMTAVFLLSTSAVWNAASRSELGVAAADEIVANWEAELEKSRRESLRQHMSFYVDERNLQPVPTDWIDRDSCPACFGVDQDLCRAIDTKDLLVEIPEIPTSANLKGVYRGKWLDIPVAVRRLTDRKQFKLFDEFVCREATGNATCDVGSAILDRGGIVQRDDAMFDAERLRTAWKIAHVDSGPLSLTYTLCLTDDLVDKFRRLYADHGTGDKLSSDRKSLLFTSMVVHPEMLMIKFLKEVPAADRLVPRVYGACGRLVVVEHGGRPLHSAINSSFTERAELALQLISLLRTLWHADERWFALYGHISYSNVAVSHNGQVYLTDFKHLSIIQNHNSVKEQQLPHSEEQNMHDNEHLDIEETVECDRNCFHGLLSNLSASSTGSDAAGTDREVASSIARQSQCRLLHDVSGPYMYSELCRNILADVPHEHDQYRGLLYDVPNDDDMMDRRQRVEQALNDCINLPAVKRRIEAVESLSELLSMYTGLRLE